MYKTITDIIGNTPLVQLQKITSEIPQHILVKLEYVNPGGSVKDRIAYQIISDAEKSGKLKPGGTIIEATGSGNTGIGLAIVAAARGYKTVFTMPDKNSPEKINILRAYGAEVIVCPTNVAPDDPKSYYRVAEKLANETPNSYYASQYTNPSNPHAHYHTTGPEIWEQTKGKIDYFVAGMGSGGTITGTAHYLKEQNPGIKVIGIDAVGSIYKDFFTTKQYTSEPKNYLIEGIGEDFLPETINFDLIDEVVQISDKHAYQMARTLAREEGLLVGSTSGAAIAGVLEFIRQNKVPQDKTFVALLPDSGRSYLSKIFNDEWMKENNLL